MAKSPITRRGITLGARVPTTTSLDFLCGTAATEPVGAPAPGPTPLPAAGPEAVAGPLLTSLSERVAQVLESGADLERRWLTDAQRLRGQLQAQLQELEQQQGRIARQTQRLEALERSRRASGRLGGLLFLLGLSVATALGVHAWPRVQDFAVTMERAAARVGQPVPQTQEGLAPVEALKADLKQLGGALATLNSEVAGVRADLGALGQGMATLAADKAPREAGTTGAAAQAAPRVPVPSQGPSQVQNQVPSQAQLRPQHPATMVNTVYRGGYRPW